MKDTSWSYSIWQCDYLLSWQLFVLTLPIHNCNCVWQRFFWFMIVVIWLFFFHHTVSLYEMMYLIQNCMFSTLWVFFFIKYAFMANAFTVQSITNIMLVFLQTYSIKRLTDHAAQTISHVLERPKLNLASKVIFDNALSDSSALYFCT